MEHFFFKSQDPIFIGGRNGNKGGQSKEYQHLKRPENGPAIFFSYITVHWLRPLIVLAVLAVVTINKVLRKLSARLDFFFLPVNGGYNTTGRPGIFFFQIQEGNGHQFRPSDPLAGRRLRLFITFRKGRKIREKRSDTVKNFAALPSQVTQVLWSLIRLADLQPSFPLENSRPDGLLKLLKFHSGRVLGGF